MSKTPITGQTSAGIAPVEAPVRIAAVARTTNPTALADGRVTEITTDKVGRQVATLISSRDLLTQVSTTISNSAAETAILPAPGAAQFFDLTVLVITNVSAVATQIDFRDSLAGAIRLTIMAPASTTVEYDVTPYVLGQVANGVWTATCTSATSDIRILALAAKNV